MINTKKPAGFTLVELMVSIAIMMLLYALSVVSLSRLPSDTALSSTYDQLIMDIRSQQNKAMTGLEGSSYGVHFENQSYTLFKGGTYSQSDPTNNVLELDPNLAFTAVSVPASSFVFSPGTGDISGYVPASDSLTISNSATGKSKTLKINKYAASY